MNKTFAYPSSRAHLDASTRIYQAIFLILIFFHFEQCLGSHFNQNETPGIEEIKSGMDKIASGFPENGVFLLRKGRSLLFDQRKDPLIEILLTNSLLEEARAELLLADKKEGLKREIHLEAAFQLLKEIEGSSPSLESHLLLAKLLQKRDERELALQKIDLWLKGAKNSYEKGKFLLAKGEILQNHEQIFREALLAFETAGWEGEEALNLRLYLAKIHEGRGENIEALRMLSKVVNVQNGSPLVEDALALRGELLGKIGRNDLKERHASVRATCGN